MVETNADNNDGSAKDGAPRKRVRLFGGRRAKTVDTAVAVDGAGQAPAEQEEATTPTASVKAAQPEAAQPEAAQPVERPQTSEATRGRGRKASVDAHSDAWEPAIAALSPEPTRPARPSTSLLFQAPNLPTQLPTRQDRRVDDRRDDADESTTVRRRSRRRSGEEERVDDETTPPNTVVKVRQPRQQQQAELITEPQKVRGSTRLEAKKQRRRDGRDAGRRRPVITEAEFLARRESVDRVMVVRQKANRIQIGVLEDGVLVEHYVAQSQEASLIGNVYLGRVQNVLPSMEAAFVDIGRGRNAVLYSGEVDWDAAAENSTGGGSQARRIELALKPGDKVLVQVTKDPIGHKGARLTSQVSLPGRYLVYVPNGSMNGISRKLPDTERARLKKILKEVLPENVGVIVRTAAEGATEEQLTLDVNRLTSQWAALSATLENSPAPALLHSEPDLLIKIIRDVFNEDFHKLVIDGDDAYGTITTYLGQVAPDLIDRVETYTSDADSFDEYRVSEQIEKALDRKVWLPSGGSLVIDRTEAMTVVDVNTGKFVGSGGNLEETVTKNNLEAAEELVRQLRLRDIGGIIVVDFIDMVLETNRDLVLRRLVECLSRDRTKHQVAEVTSLGLVQMTRKKLGLGLIESFSEPCETCAGRGIIIHHDPVAKHRQSAQPEIRRGRSNKNGGNGNGNGGAEGGRKAQTPVAVAKTHNGTHAITDDVKNALAQIAASTIVSTDTASIAIVADQSAVKAAAGPASDAGEPVQDHPETDVQQLQRTESSSGKSRGRGRGKSQSVSKEDEPLAAPSKVAVAISAEDVAIQTAEAAVEILEIPLKKSSRPSRRISSHDAEQILDSVLDALPEPKQPGQGRSRVSRRASSAGIVTTAESTADGV
ncbi:MAG: ribonuclease [Homoserinimonas sp.]|nr:ribonuclease [Homoserinimonas sp.]